VSAVEFKAGPTTNPHAPRMRSKRATGVIRGVTPLMNQNNFSGIFTVTLSEEDAAMFPAIDVNLDSGTVDFDTGDMFYTVEITLPDGTAQKCIYWGDGKATFAHANLVGFGSGTVTTSEIPNSTIILETIESRPSLPNFLTETHSNFILGQPLKLTKKSFDPLDEFKK
jgi:hypothetical protein